MNGKTILFDLSSTQPGMEKGFHGGGEYAKAVFLRLCELVTPEISIEVFYDPDRKIEKDIFNLCELRGFAVNLCKNNYDINKLLAGKKYDVFYTALPYSYSGLIIPPETKFIYTVHGLRSMEYPIDKYELKYRKSGLKTKIKHIVSLIFPAWWRRIKLKKDIYNFNKLFSLTENQSIITISNHSKYAISFFFPNLNKSQIKILYSPPKNISTGEQSNLDILDYLSLKSGKYILMICGDRSEKGAYRACGVIHNLFEKHKSIPEDIKVLVLGVSYRKEYIKLTHNSNRFIFYGYAAINDLETLYKNAHLFVYPTLNEGFGAPPVEAMKYETLCACSANSAVTEICGDAVLYFNPHDEIEMGIRILQSFDDDIRRRKKQEMPVRFQAVNKKQKEDLDTLIQYII